MGRWWWWCGGRAGQRAHLMCVSYCLDAITKHLMKAAEGRKGLVSLWFEGKGTGWPLRHPTTV